MTLTTKKYEVIEVDQYDVDALIQEHFGHEFSISADQELNRDGVKKFVIDGKVGEYERSKIERFKADGSGSWLAGALLNQLAADGLIENGTYLIAT